MNPQIPVLIAAGIIWAIGIFGLIIHRSMIQICVSLSIMESSLILLLVALAYVPKGNAPILDGHSGPFADPLPHALALTAIVIGAGILAIALALTVAVHQHYGTTDLSQLFPGEPTE
jgi:multisubunit Na+/H+ antiporter MnhC subunit